MRLAILLLLLVSIQVRAEGFSVGYGPVLAARIPCDTYALSFGQTINDKWEGRVVIQGEGICQTNLTGPMVESNIGAGVVRTLGTKFQFGVGAFLWEHDSYFFGEAIGKRSDIQLTGILLIRYNWKRISLEWFHASTGAATPTNKGLNTFLVNARF